MTSTSSDDEQYDHCACCGHRRSPFGCGGPSCPCGLDVSPHKDTDGNPQRRKTVREDVQPMPSWFRTRVQAVRGTTPTTSEETP